MKAPKVSNRCHISRISHVLDWSCIPELLKLTLLNDIIMLRIWIYQIFDFVRTVMFTKISIEFLFQPVIHFWTDKDRGAQRIPLFNESQICIPTQCRMLSKRVYRHITFLLNPLSIWSKCQNFLFPPRDTRIPYSVGKAASSMKLKWNPYSVKHFPQFWDVKSNYRLLNVVPNWRESNRECRKTK